MAATIAAALMTLALAVAEAGPAPTVLGDVSCDERVNSVDAALVLQLEAGLLSGLPCPENADVVLDGFVNSLDATVILQLHAGLIPDLPVGGDQEGPLRAEVVLDDGRMSFQPGEEISMTLSITNTSDEAVSRGYGSTQEYDFVVYSSSGREVWRWSHGMFFFFIIVHRTLEPGETWTYVETWDQLTNDDEPAEPGNYAVRGYDVGCNSLAHQCDLGAIVHIEIKP